jgi:hypothetical protein
MSHRYDRSSKFQKRTSVIDKLASYLQCLEFGGEEVILQWLGTRSDCDRLWRYLWVKLVRGKIGRVCLLLLMRCNIRVGNRQVLRNTSSRELNDSWFFVRRIEFFICFLEVVMSCKSRLIIFWFWLDLFLAILL